MINNKVIIALLLSIFCGFTLSSLDTSGVKATGWKASSLVMTEKALADSFPLIVQDAKPSGADGLTLRSTFDLPKDWSGPLGIAFYKNNMACKVYVNDVYLDTLGRPGPDFFFQPYISRGVLVPESVLKETNTITLELWNDTGLYKLRMMEFMDENTYRDSMSFYNFLDVQLPRFACVLLLFVAIYLMFSYINYVDKQESLFLSLSATFFSIYLLNVTVFDAVVPYVTLKAALYSCFPLSVIFLFRFFRKFFKMKTGDRTMWVITVIGLFFAGGYFFQRDTASLDSWHSLMILYPVSAIVFSSVGAVKCLRSGHLGSISIIVGLFVAVLFSAYDIYFFLGDKTPFILLQGLGFMSLIIGTFYSFSQEIADTNKKVIRYSQEMIKNTEMRDNLFRQIQQDTIKSESASSKLDLSIERVGSLITQYLVSIEQINMNIESQNDQVQSNKMNVDQIFQAIQETSGMVAQHENLVQVTVQNVHELTEGIHRTDELVKVSGETIKKLTSVCKAADKDVAESARFVDDLANYSKNINEIVKSISDLAEQTNILSINAAIEAARSGQMGKGFAVVAGEIRSLATKSGESASQINVILGTMVEKIANIQRQETQVSGRLKAIIGENTNIEDSIAEIFRVLKKQLERNTMISTTVSELVATVHRISDQTRTQKLSGEDLKQSLYLLETITSAILTSSTEQKSCNEELKNNLEQLRTVSEENLEVISDLKTLIA